MRFSKFVLEKLHFKLPQNYDPQSQRPIIIYTLRKAEMPKLVISNLHRARRRPLGVFIATLLGTSF